MTKIYPYSYSWVNNKYIINSLVKAYSMGVKSCKFAFIISENKNICSDFANNLNDILQFIKMGGDLILSFGGADGIMLDEAISDVDTLYNMYINIINKTGCYKLDFDIESGTENKINVNNLRNIVLLKLQQKYPNLYISFTLGGDTKGLGNSQFQIIKDALNCGLKINIVNIMLMCNNFNNPGQDSINSCESLFNQLKSIYLNKSSNDIYGMMSPCIMPGKDGNNTYFTQDDARKLSDYCKNKNVGEISYWALQRDVISSSTNYNLASLINKSNLEFYNIFVNNQIPVIDHGSIIGSNFLDNIIKQDIRNDWIKIDNVVCGESVMYSYKSVLDDIGSVLDACLLDSKAVVVNYNWTSGKAYIKTGFNPKLKNNCINKSDFTVFIKKNKLNGNVFKLYH